MVGVNDLKKKLSSLFYIYIYIYIYINIYIYIFRKKDGQFPSKGGAAKALWRHLDGVCGNVEGCLQGHHRTDELGEVLERWMVMVWIVKYMHAYMYKFPDTKIYKIITTQKHMKKATQAHKRTRVV